MVTILASTIGEANLLVLEFIDFYPKLYTKDNNLRFLPTNLDWSLINESQSLYLERDFLVEEVLVALNSLGSTLRVPMVLLVEFFKNSWNTLKQDIIGYVY